MKRMIALLAVIFATLAFGVANASAYWLSGWVMYNGYTVPYASVHLHNDTTGAWGSTTANSQGAYTFTGMVGGYHYFVWGCAIYYISDSDYFTMPNYDYAKSLYLHPTSYCQ